MKKIAIITPFLANGGLEKVAVVGAEELSRNFDVTLIVMDSFHIDYPYNGKIIDLEVSLMHRGVFKRIYNIVSAIIKLRKLKKYHDFDMVISHGELANLPNVFSGGEKNILVVHGDRFAEAALVDVQSRFISKIIKYIYFAKNISKVVTVSEGIRESLISHLDIKDQDIVTIYNPFNLDEIKTLSHEPLDKYNHLLTHEIITTAGRLTMQKGQWYLLRIFKELKKSNPEIKLIILGDGEMKKKLINLSEDLKLKTYSVWSEKEFDDSYDVYFLGFQKNPFKFIKVSKLFVMTSLWEGFGNTIVEAMECGTPVISTNCKSGPGEIIFKKDGMENTITKPIYDGCGVLMPIFDNEFLEANTPLVKKELLWVNTLQILLADDEKLTEYEKMGIQKVEEFSLETIMLDWKKLIEVVIHE